MSVLFAYICTKSTIDPYVPTATANIAMLSRDVSDGFMALAGGYHVVGKIVFFPVQRSVPFHLLCDGSEVAKASFPELYAYLGDNEGTATDPANFVLPNYVGSITAAPTAEPETVQAGTVSSPSTETPVPGTTPTAPVTSGPVNSGGRTRSLTDIA